MHARLLSLLLLLALALALALLAPLILLAGCIRHTHLVHFSFFHIHLLHSHLLVICIILCIYFIYTHTHTHTAQIQKQLWKKLKNIVLINPTVKPNSQAFFGRVSIAASFFRPFASCRRVRRVKEKMAE